MAKPWAKLEVDYINHDKFLALNANAICLWHEGKNYCDREHTDGLIPTERAKRFRFYSKKTVAMLLTSAGKKVGTDIDYQPLWERHLVGFKMVGYLEYNDCRDVVLARKAAAAAAKKLDAERKAAAREAKKLRMSGPVSEGVSGRIQ